MDYTGEIKALMNIGTSPCVSMYLPLAVGNESVQAKITLKALMREAETRLLEMMRRPEVVEFLSPLDTFLMDSRQWEKRGSGLAVFLAPGVFRHLVAPVEFNRRLQIGDVFHIKPLLQLVNNPGDYYVLDLDLGKTRAFYGTEFSLEEIELQGTPLSLEEAMQYDDPEAHLQFHTSTPGRGGEGRRAAMFHGHGGSADFEKNNILRYFQQLDGGLRAAVGSAGTPVVLGGAEYLTAIFREASSYGSIADSILAGSLSNWQQADIRKAAWQIAEPYYRAVELRERGKYQALLGTGLASNNLEEIILGCYTGRLATLFVSLDRQVLGDVDLGNNAVHVFGEEAEGQGKDLLNLAAMQAIAQGGTVFVVPPDTMPDGAVAAAIFRY